MSVKDYQREADLNISISGISVAEGCAPSGINNAIRQLMADVKEESEAQASAVAEARSTAEEQVSELDAALRALVAQEVAKYLPLTGGKMSGSISFSNSSHIRVLNSSDYLRVWGGGGNTSGDSGANIILFGRDHSTGWGAGSGGCIIRTNNATDGEKGYAFKSDGTLETPNGNVLTSAGGKLTGALTSSVDYAIDVVRSSGQTCGMRIENTNTQNAVRFVISATGNRGLYDETTKSWIINFDPDGDLCGKGKPIVVLTASGRDDAGNWYCKYSNGLIVQGGVATGNNAGGVSVTLPTPFTTTTYYCAAHAYGGSSTLEITHYYISSQTTTDFYFVDYHIGGNECRWFAIGF